jgi:hypothetical protein
VLFGGAIRNIQVRYFVDHDPDHRATVFVTGMNRSGTTWLMDLLNAHNDFRLVFEPFDHSRVALAVNFKDHQYLRAENDDPHFLAPARAILSGRVREDFVDQHNRRLFSSRRLVKEVRASLFLPWLLRHFPGMPIVCIVRHPFAVAASRRVSEADIDLHEDFLSQPDLIADHLLPFVETIAACVTPFERSVAEWCIEVGVPLSQLKPTDAHIVAYEHLCTRPDVELQAICGQIGLAFHPGMLRRLQRPSSTTSHTDRLAQDWRAGGRGLVESWTRRISPQEVARGLEILVQFGMDDLYGADPMPLVDRLPAGHGMRCETTKTR